MEIENDQQPRNEAHSCVEGIILYKGNSIEVWRENPASKGLLENVCEVNVFCNILKVLLVKSSSNEKGDILFLLAHNMQFRFFRLSMNGEIDILHEGTLQNPDTEKINENSIVFISQLSSGNTNYKQSSGLIGIYAHYTNINVITFRESSGEIL